MMQQIFLGYGGGGGVSASGGNQTLTPGNGYTYHTFTSAGALIVTGSGDVEDLLLVTTQEQVAEVSSITHNLA